MPHDNLHFENDNLAMKTTAPDKVYESILHNLIISMARLVNPNIKTALDKSGHVLDIYEIEEGDLARIEFPVNKPDSNHKLSLVGGYVYTGDKIMNAENVPGLSKHLINAFMRSDYLGFKNGDKTHAPFCVSTDKNKQSISETIDILSDISRDQRPLKGVVKKIYLRLENCWFDPNPGPC